NLYGEIVRGKDFENFPGNIRKGILLHRSIDTFTDAHEIVKKSSQKFHENYGKYSPIIVDVIYDYFLIKNWKTYNDQDFEAFVSDCYALFQSELENFPEQLQFIVNHLIKYDWFHNYQTLEGVESTLKGISQRSKFENNIYKAVQEVQLNEEELNEEFNLFFPELINHCKLFLEI